VGEKTPTQLGPLERANLNHWTEFAYVCGRGSMHVPSVDLPFEHITGNSYFVASCCVNHYK
jgi:hypothetical protein